MALYPRLHTTNVGRELVALSNVQGKPIRYTKAVLGDAEFNDSVDRLGGVIAPKLECMFHNGTNKGDGRFQMEFVVDNGSLENGFYAREIGIYAKLDDTEEILFSYTNGGNFVDYIPDKAFPINAQIVDVEIQIGDASNITLMQSDETYATLEDLLRHNESLDAHANKFAEYMPLAGGDFTGLVNMFQNPAISDNSQQAATTSFVQKLLLDFLTRNTSNNTKLRNAILDAIQSGYHGMAQDFSNPNGWWCKMPNGLLIQGGLINKVSGSIITLPLSVEKILWVGSFDNLAGDTPFNFSFNTYTKTSFKVFGDRINGTVNRGEPLWGYYIAFTILL